MALKRFTKSSNPMMGDEKYRQSIDRDMVPSIGVQERMTVSGAINKTFMLACIMLATTMISYTMPSQMFLWVGMLGGLGLLLFASFKPHLSPYIAPAYAAVEGLFVGAISAMYALSLGPAIIFHAVTLTLSILFAMLFIYKTGIIQVTSKFRTGVMMATGGIMLVYVLNLVLSMFGINIPFLHEGDMIGIGISLVIIGVASLNLLLDFDNFEKGEQYGAAKYMEWYSAMGLLVTIVWIYVELLRLLAVISSSD